MASGVRFALLLCLSIGLLAPSCCEETKTSCPGPCPPGWTQFGSRCFNFHFQGNSWIDAENFCKTTGGHLASVRSGDEHIFLKSLVMQVTGEYRRTWIGGYDSVLGVWMWSDGSPFNYQRWDKAQPDNFQGIEHCVELIFNGRDWNDSPCAEKFSFLCSRDL